MTRRLLVVEDHAKTAESLRLYLEAAGFAVTLVDDGRAALVAAERERPDLVVLDVMLPGLDGLAVTRALRGRERRDARDGAAAANEPIPILLLTARATEQDKLAGLELGADDYVTKPFSPREVVARVRAILRRSGRGGGMSARRDGSATKERGSAPIAELLRVGALTLDVAEHRVTIGGDGDGRGSRELLLPPAEWKLLAAFARRPGRVLAREELGRLAFGRDWDAQGRTIDAHVARLRRKLEGAAAPGDVPRITTIFGVGYRLAPAGECTP